MKGILILVLCVVLVGCGELLAGEEYKLKITVETKDLPAHYKHHTLRFTITGPDDYKNTVTTISLNDLNRLVNSLDAQDYCGEYYLKYAPPYQNTYPWNKFKKSEIKDECDGHIKINRGWHSCGYL